jgi:hypothetical protein
MGELSIPPPAFTCHRVLPVAALSARHILGIVRGEKKSAGGGQNAGDVRSIAQFVAPADLAGLIIDGLQN